MASVLRGRKTEIDAKLVEKLEERGPKNNKVENQKKDIERERGAGAYTLALGGRGRQGHDLQRVHVHPDTQKTVSGHGHRRGLDLVHHLPSIHDHHVRRDLATSSKKNNCSCYRDLDLCLELGVEEPEEMIWFD